MKELKYVCKECGSEDVEAKVWVNLNTLELDFSTLENGDEEDFWCNDCQEHNKVILEE